MSLINSTFVTEVHDLFLRGGTAQLEKVGEDENANLLDTAKKTIALLLKQNARKPETLDVKML